MVLIKLSVAFKFILAAAAIAPIVALPTGDLSITQDRILRVPHLPMDTHPASMGE